MGEATGTALERRGPREDDEGIHHGQSPGGDGGFRAEPPIGGAHGFFQQYKPEQGKSIRWGTLACGGALIAWGAVFLYDQLQVYEGDEAWRLLITTGLPIAFGVAFFAVAWWVSFVSRSSSDFMIATEGEMKKVSWSSRREIIGSTKVVILFTLLMSVFLFVVDLAFQAMFSGLGILKR
jgi:preprotein translocase subunit SecE